MTSEIGMLTLHASALINFQTTVRILQTFFSKRFWHLSISMMQADVSKVIEIRDGPEELTKEVIDAKLLK